MRSLDGGECVFTILCAGCMGGRVVTGARDWPLMISCARFPTPW